MRGGAHYVRSADPMDPRSGGPERSMEWCPLTRQKSRGRWFLLFGAIFCFCVPAGKRENRPLSVSTAFQDLKGAALRGLVTLLGPVILGYRFTVKIRAAYRPDVMA